MSLRKKTLDEKPAERVAPTTGWSCQSLKQIGAASGFTLIELLVVIGIIAILATL
jgi:prepilin-type N-terminal cleavage/methylation domain-containing protein